MNAVKDITAPFSQDGDDPPGFLGDLLRAAKGQDSLGIYRAPEGDLIAELFLQAFGLHVFSCDLYRVKSVDANIDKVRYEVIGRATTVKTYFDLMVG